MIRRFALATGFAVATFALISALGGIGAAEAANPCKKNCKTVYKVCKGDRKSVFDEAKDAFIDMKKVVCKQQPKEARKACVETARAAFKIAKSHKKLGMKDCKFRFRDVQVPLCTEMGLLDACSPMDGFPDALETSLF